MYALDTNILVRFLVNDDQVQAKQVHQLFQQLEQNPMCQDSCHP